MLYWAVQGDWADRSPAQQQAAAAAAMAAIGQKGGLAAAAIAAAGPLPALGTGAFFPNDAARTTAYTVPAYHTQQQDPGQGLLLAGEEALTG